MKLVTSSLFTKLLHQYSTRTQTIGTGTVSPTYIDTGAPASSTVTDAAIQAELLRLINSGAVPAPTSTFKTNNNLYMFHFPPGVAINDAGYYSCKYFCAYHGTMVATSGSTKYYIYYGVIPDLGGACQGGCGPYSVCNVSSSLPLFSKTLFLQTRNQEHLFSE